MTDTDIKGLLERARAYVDGIDEKNDLRVGILMCREMIGNLANALERLSRSGAVPAGWREQPWMRTPEARKGRWDSHDQAMSTIRKAAGVSTLSYEEAVLIYARARGYIIDDAESMASDPPAAAPKPPSDGDAPVPTLAKQWQHHANELADGMTNGIQWLRNIKDGISTVDEALEEMNKNWTRIKAERPPLIGGASASRRGGPSPVKGYCTDCEAETVIHDGRYGCGSGRVIAPRPTQWPDEEAVARIICCGGSECRVVKINKAHPDKLPIPCDSPAYVDIARAILSLFPSPAEIERAAYERAAKVAEEHTPKKIENTLAAHVTGSVIQRAMRAIRTKGGE